MLQGFPRVYSKYRRPEKKDWLQKMNENGKIKITERLSVQGYVGQPTTIPLIEGIEGCVCMTLNMGCGYI